MNKIIGIFAFSGLLMIAFHVSAQMSYGGQPHVNDLKNAKPIPAYELPAIDNQALLLEDEELNRKGRPFRIGTVHDVLISNATDGVWDTLPNGDRLWRVAVSSKDATFVRPIFDTYVIPDGAELFVYTPEQDFVIGKFTNANADEGRFHTQIIPGETFVMEYYEPADAAFRGRLVVNQIGRGHHNAFGSGRYGEKGRLGTAEGNCHINVGTGKELTIRELSELVAKAVGFEGTIEFDSTKPDGTMRKLIDVSKLHRLGWTHKVEIDEGVKKLFDWYKQSLEK